MRAAALAGAIISWRTSRSSAIRRNRSRHIPRLHRGQPRVRREPVLSSPSGKPRAERPATDPDARPLGCGEADGPPGEGAAPRAVPGGGRRLDAARAAGGRPARGGHSRHPHRQAVQGRPAGALAAGTVPQTSAVRRGTDLDLRRERLWSNRGAPGEGPRHHHRRDGRRPLERALAVDDRPVARPLDRPRGGELAGRRRVLPQGGHPRRNTGDDPFGDR